MRRLFIILFVLLASISAFSQADDTTKYIKYPGVYGIQYPRYMATKVLRPPVDTIYSKSGLAILGTILYYGDGTRWRASASGGSGTVTSVGLSMPSGFSVAGSPVTGSGTLAVTGAGTTGQVILGDGSLGTFNPWNRTGNTGTNPASDWLGTNTNEVNASLLLKVGGEYAGYIRRTISNDSSTPTAPNHGFTSYGQYAGDYIIGRITTTPADSSLFMLNQTLYGYQTGRRLGVLLPSDRAGVTPSDENLFIGNSVGRWTRVSSAAYGKGRNTIVSSGFGFFRNLSGSYNGGFGQFVLELNNGGNGNNAFGDGGLRSNIDGDFNATFGGSGMLYNSTGVYSVTINSAGTGYAPGDPITFSAPLSNGPGTCVGTATGVVATVDGGGGITGITVTYPGCGYVSRGDSCFYVGTCHPAVTATAGGAGVGASLSPVLRSGDRNTGIGTLNGAFNVLSQDMIYVGYGSGKGTRYWDNKGISIGNNSGVLSTVAPGTAVDNWVAFGQDADVAESNTAALGDSLTYPYKWVINGAYGDSAFRVNKGFHVTGGVRFSGLPLTITPASYHFIPKYTENGTVTSSLITEVLSTGFGSGGGIFIDDVTAGISTTNGNKLYIRNSYDGDASANAVSQLAQRISGSGSTQKYFLGQLAANIPDGTSLSNYIGKNTGSKNAYLQTFVYAGNNSNGNYVVDQFVGVANVFRRYASGNVTFGVAADNGYNVEVGSTMKLGSYLDLADIAAPATPSAGNGRVYVEVDSLRFKNDVGTVFTLGAAGSGEINTASNLGGGLANFDSKSGVDLRFNSFNATDFDLATNVISIDNALKTDWNTAYTDRLKWDGGATGLNAATGRTSLGGTTIGQNVFTSTNPGAITFGRANADNTFDWLSASDFRTAIGAGTGSGTVNTGAANKAVYYLSAGTTVDDFTAIDYGLTNSTMKLTTQNAADTGFSIIATTGQTARLMNVRNASGTNVFYISSDGTGNYMGYRPTIGEYGSVSGTDIAWGSVDGLNTYNVLMSSSSYGVKFRTNAGLNPFQYDYNTGGDARMKHDGWIDMKEISAPGTPASGYASAYVKTDGLWYGKDDAGAETKLSNETISYARLVKTLNVGTTDAGNVGTGEDDLMSFTVPADTLSNTGDYIDFEMAFTFAANSNNKVVKVYWAGTQIYTSGTQAQNDGNMVIKGKIIRTGAATQKIVISQVNNTTNFNDETTYTTGAATLSAGNILKATGEATSNDDIIQKTMTVVFNPNH